MYTILVIGFPLDRYLPYPSYSRSRDLRFSNFKSRTRPSVEPFRKKICNLCVKQYLQALLLARTFPALPVPSDKSPMINRNRKSTSDLLSRGKFDSIDPRINSLADRSPRSRCISRARARTENGKVYRCITDPERPWLENHR